MSQRETHRALANYVNTATDLAEDVKRCIQHNEGIIDDALVLSLNEFAIAANQIKDMTDEINKRVRKYDN